MPQTEFVLGLFGYVFGYIKTFDPALADEHPDNYYMEREWRVIGQVHFRSCDVSRILVPTSFVEQFRLDVPEYEGQVQGL